MPGKGEGYDEYHLTETTSYTVAFIPGLALSAVITGVALWGGSIPRLRVPGLVPSPSQSCWGWFRQHHLSAHLEKL